MIEQDKVIVDVNQLINEIVDILGPPETIKFTIGKLAQINFQRQMLFQLFQNLISNAIKFSPSDSTIEIWSESSDNQISYFVKDHGEGIESKYFDKIFDIFQTLHSKDEIEGTGVGLAIVKKIVDNTNGKIDVQSDYGHGTTFKVTFFK